MARPRFSEMLVDRRRQLGLSIDQASRVLKLKSQVLVAFEEGDFENIPKSGYAQGMLSSYARYLGLNPRTVVDQFQEDLYEFSHGVSSHELRRRTREGRSDTSAMDLTGASSAPLVQGRRRFMNNSGTGSLRSDPRPEDSMEIFTTTTASRPRSQAWAESAATISGELERTDETQLRPYTSQTPYSSRTPAPRVSSMRAAPSRSAYSDLDEGRYGRDDIVRREAPQYEDQSLPEPEMAPYHSASTSEGRRAYEKRGTVQQAQRPNVARRESSLERSRLRERDRRRTTAHNGILGVIEAFFSNRTRTIGAIVLLLALVLTLLIVTSVRSCASTRIGGDRRVDVGTATSPVTTETITAETPEEPQTPEAQTPAPNPVTEVNVVVSVDDAQVSWVEIILDGNTEVAETITGPWERSYQVQNQIDVQVGDISAVSVTNNGEPVQFEMRSSGIGGVTMYGPQSSTTDDTQDSTDSADTSDTSDDSESFN